MQLVVGLGNPGAAYAATRHNVGFRCVDELVVRLRCRFGVVEPEYVAAVAAGPAGPVTILKPLTYMNRSGLAVAAWARDSGWSVALGGDDEGDEGLVVPLVICDDIHLPLGSLRIRSSGSDGGQNGLGSVLETVASRQVPRMRLGVGPADGHVVSGDWADYVLAEFETEEYPAVDDLIARSADAVLDILARGVVDAASRHNRRILSDTDEPR